MRARLEFRPAAASRSSDIERLFGARGAEIVEGYPVEAEGERPDPFVWTGQASGFRRAGFREVARRSPARPIMRRALRGPRRLRAPGSEAS